MLPETGQATISARLPWWEQLANLAFLSTFLFGAIPETLTGKIYLGPIPLIFWIFYVGCFGFLLELIASRPAPTTVPLLLTLWAAFMTLTGVAGGSDLKWLAIDLSSFGGFIIGYIWVKRRQTTFLINASRRLLLGVLPLLAFSLIGLVSGWISPGGSSGRLYTYSIFHSTTLLSMILPLIAISGRYRPLKGYPDWLLPTGVLMGYLLVFASSFLTATRSVLFGGIASLLLTSRLLLKGKKGASLSLLLAAGLLIYPLFTANLLAPPEFGQLGERLSNTTDLAQEQRWVEVEMLLSQLPGSSLWLGLGFGSRFVSPVEVGDTDLAISPHIAIFTFLQKGGITLFLALIIIPYLRLFIEVLFSRKNLLQVAVYAGALMYLFLATMSSGWEFYNLFLYGCLLGAKIDP